MNSIFFFLLLGNSVIGQVAGALMAKEFSKEIALYRAKEFVIHEILGESNDIVQFQIDPLASATSGELTSLVYHCDSKNKEGLVLGFFGTYWNDAGVSFQGYKFKNLPKEQALLLLAKIDQAIEEHYKWLSNDSDNNNIYFQFEDLTILIYDNAGSTIRIFWNKFDATWNGSAFDRTKKRFEKKLH
ncbi:MAG: hypothetical protein ABI763_00690 [Bacteroidota bacterium]